MMNKVPIWKKLGRNTNLKNKTAKKISDEEFAEEKIYGNTDEWI